MTPQQPAKATQRRLVVAANSELQERGLLKHARVTTSVTAALRERGADELTARLDQSGPRMGSNRGHEHAYSARPPGSWPV